MQTHAIRAVDDGARFERRECAEVKIDMGLDLLSGTECNQGLWHLGDEEASGKDGSCGVVSLHSSPAHQSKWEWDRTGSSPEGRQGGGVRDYLDTVTASDLV